MEKDRLDCLLRYFFIFCDNRKFMLALKWTPSAMLNTDKGKDKTRNR